MMDDEVVYCCGLNLDAISEMGILNRYAFA